MKRRKAKYQSQSNRQMLILILVTLILAVFGGCRGTPQSESATSLGADEVLRGMSGKLANARQLSVAVNRTLDAGLVEGRSSPAETQIEIAVSRPNKMVAKTRSETGVLRFFTDGKNVTLSDEFMKLYATVSAPGTIDEILGSIDAQYQFTPPLAEFTLNDPYKKISQQIQSNTYVERELVNGIECHHLKMVGAIADTDLWITTKEQLPLRLIATFKGREGSPQLKADFSEWNLSAIFDDKVFSFSPAKDAEKIEMIATERAEDKELKTTMHSKQMNDVGTVARKAQHRASTQ